MCVKQHQQQQQHQREKKIMIKNWPTTTNSNNESRFSITMNEKQCAWRYVCTKIKQPKKNESFYICLILINLIERICGWKQKTWPLKKQKKMFCFFIFFFRSNLCSKKINFQISCVCVCVCVWWNWFQTNKQTKIKCGFRWQQEYTWKKTIKDRWQIYI